MSRMKFGIVFAFVALGAAFIVGIGYAGIDESAPMVTTILGFITLAVTQLMGNKTAEETKEDLRNGRVEKLVRSAIEKIASEGDSALNINRDPETHASGTGGGDKKGDDSHG